VEALSAALGRAFPLDQSGPRFGGVHELTDQISEVHGIEGGQGGLPPEAHAAGLGFKAESGSVGAGTEPVGLQQTTA
jgi:hypothetical protein